MNDKKMLFISYGIVAVAVLSFCFLCWRISATKDVSNLSGGAGSVAGGIESAKDLNQQADTERAKAEAGIAGAEKSADRIETSIKQSADITSQLSASIDRCQQILNRVRERGAKETK